jgi:hypothetical protein
MTVHLARDLQGKRVVACAPLAGTRTASWWKNDDPKEITCLKCAKTLAYRKA